MLVVLTGFGVRVATIPAQAQFAFSVTNGAAHITGYIGANPVVIIPGSIKNYPVTAIESNAFGGQTNLTSVTMADSVTNIGDGAFNSCGGLTNLPLGNGVIRIGEQAFDGCTGLTRVEIPGSVTSIGPGAFEYCSGLTNVIIGNRVTSLGVDVFAYCPNLRQAYFQGNAPSVNGLPGSTDSTVFLNETGTVYYALTTAGWRTMFGGWNTRAVTNLTYVTTDGAITITGYLTGYAVSSGDIIIPATINGSPVTTIGELAFANQPDLITVVLSNNVTSIGDRAFEDCSALTNVVIGQSVTNLGVGAFAYCPNLVQAIFQGNPPSVDGQSGSTDSTVFFSDGYGTVYYALTNTAWDPTFGGWFTSGSYGSPGPASDFEYETVNGAITITGYTGSGGNLTIPGTIDGYPVTLIGDYAFNDFHGVLSGVTMPNSVTGIGTQAFAFCNLTNVTISTSATSIGSRAFWGCDGLTNVTIPNSASSIGTYAFASCTSLTSLTIPNGDIGNFAFDYCSGLTNVVIGNSITNIGTFAFESCINLHRAYFLGNAPTVGGADGSTDSSTFVNETGMVYCVSGTVGWGVTFGGWPTAVWRPQTELAGSAVGYTNGFGFAINWASGQSVVVEASTNLQDWWPVSTNRLVNGTDVFRDSNWMHYPRRFYRVRPE